MLANLNRTMLLDVGERDIATFCTVLLAFATRAGRGFRLRLACAGHPAPLLIDAAGRSTEIAIDGPPAGWFEDPTFGETEVELGPGASLVMYTDGLIEARERGQLLGIDAVRSALEDAAGSTEETLAAVRDIITAPEVTVGDDVAVLTVRARLDG